MANEKIEYRFIDAGYGGTFRFDKKGAKQEQIPFIGTYDCMSCTGVYFPIDSQRCFLAHINPAGKTGGGVEKNSLLEKFIEDKVLQLLQEHSRDHQWSARSVIDYIKMSDIGQKPVIICPFMQRGTVGYSVLQGIKRFFGADFDVEKYKHTGVTGFVIDHDTGKLDLFESSDDVSKFGEEALKRHEEKYKRLPVFATDAKKE